MTGSANKKELATSPIFLLSIGVFTAAFDAVSSVWLINFSGLQLVEFNRLLADESGHSVDTSKAITLAALQSSAYILLALLYARSRKPGKARYASFNQIHEKRYRAFRWAHSGLYMLIYGNFYLVFISKPFSVMVNLTDFPNMPHHIIVLLLAVFSLPLYYYTYYSTMWRYLTDEAKQRHPYLEWPYKKGLLNKDNLRLT